MTPYSRVNARGFWRPAVAERHMLDITDLWQPKFPIGREDRISTYGSCFAQHIGAALRGSGFRWFEAEEPPFGLSPENRKRFNYGVFTARTGNIYTTTMLLQWVDWALGHAPVPDEIWEDGGRFQDPFRPAIEPEGFDSVAELRACRQATLAAFRRSITQADVFVFTLGLTERWINARQGHEYAVCPGTAAGRFDPQAHVFAPLQVAQVLRALGEAMDKMRAVQPALRFLLTVSPVPLTATMSGKHVLVATMESKSILRTVAGQLAANRDHVDYFPSYEIINAPAFQGVFFDPNKRTVNPAGVAFVMRQFFAGLGIDPSAPGGSQPPRGTRPGQDATTGATEILCHEELLDAFAKR
ncbi:MAG: GSCFA domain-containing protein [Rhodobacter sp.]|nr:GSCFA domain-containing protein [Paracoccaceae bacterium]MCC0073051.1 GSCFA domain-containing protein [Rhodobacter sp.]